MRSRYTAYCLKRVDYVFDTTHPQAREPRLRESIQETADDCEWLSLTVLSTRQGLAKDKMGKVEFSAEFRYQGEPQTHHEHSRFRRFEGKWKYLDGEG